jgi:hypothetical protein
MAASCRELSEITTRWPVAVDTQKRAKMLAQFWRGFHNGGMVV